MYQKQKGYKMNKKMLIEAIAQEFDIKKTEAEGLIEDFMAVILAGLKANKEVVLPGLGKLKIQETAARSGTTPSGVVWTKEKSTKIVFKASSTLE